MAEGIQWAVHITGPFNPNVNLDSFCRSGSKLNMAPHAPRGGYSSALERHCCKSSDTLGEPAAHMQWNWPGNCKKYLQIISWYSVQKILSDYYIPYIDFDWIMKMVYYSLNNLSKKQLFSHYCSTNSGTYLVIEEWRICSCRYYIRCCMNYKPCCFFPGVWWSWLLLVVKHHLPFVVKHREYFFRTLLLYSSRDHRTLNSWKNKTNSNLKSWGAFKLIVHVERVVTLLCKAISPLCPDKTFSAKMPLFAEVIKGFILITNNRTKW